MKFFSTDIISLTQEHSFLREKSKENCQLGETDNVQGKLSMQLFLFQMDSNM